MKTKNFIKKTVHGPLEPIFSFLWSTSTTFQRFVFAVKWKASKVPRPTKAEIDEVCQNVTFIYKSFQRKKLAKRLYRNIQRYYPGVRVIIADDSKKPLSIKSKHLHIIHLPFNSGLSKGLSEALKQVKTPFTIRMDDDELLTPHTKFHVHLRFLMAHPELDLVGVSPINRATPKDCSAVLKGVEKKAMSRSPKPLKLPHGTFIDKNHIVLGKVPNIFICRTKKYKEIGYDENIKVIDHFEFFFRAAGNLVSVLSLDSFVLHYHNPFKKRYRAYRGNYQSDLQYIKTKHADFIAHKNSKTS